MLVFSRFNLQINASRTKSNSSKLHFVGRYTLAAESEVTIFISSFMIVIIINSLSQAVCIQKR